MRHIAYTTKSRTWTNQAFTAVCPRKTPYMGVLSCAVVVLYRQYVMTS